MLNTQNKLRVLGLVLICTSLSLADLDRGKLLFSVKKSIPEKTAQACVNAAINLAKEDSDFHQLLTGLPLNYERPPSTPLMQEIDRQAAGADGFNRVVYRKAPPFHAALQNLRDQLPPSQLAGLVFPILREGYYRANGGVIPNPILSAMNENAAQFKNRPYDLVRASIKTAHAKGLLEKPLADEITYQVNLAEQKPDHYSMLETRDQSDIDHTNPSKDIPYFTFHLKPVIPVSLLNDVSQPRTAPYLEMPMNLDFVFEDFGLSRYQFAFSCLLWGHREKTYYTPHELEKARVHFDSDGTALDYRGKPLDEVGSLARTLVMDKNGTWYHGNSHPSLSLGGPIAFGGTALIKKGRFQYPITRDSGHYKTSTPFFLQGIEDLERKKAFDRTTDFPLLEFGINDPAKR